VQRWLQMLKYLPAMGYEVVVYVPKNAFYPIEDPDLADDIPEGIEVIEGPILEPGQVLSQFVPKRSKRMSAGILKEKEASWSEKFLLGIRGNFFIPDARIGWVKPSVKKLLPLIQERKIQTVITTGPPHSVHLTGLALKKKTNVRWVADFRDPWTGIGYHSKLQLSSWAARRHEQLEREVLNTADLVLATSPSTAQALQDKTKQTVSVLTNGYEEVLRTTSLNTRFSIAHIGSLLSARNPKVLWQVLAELKEEIPDFQRDLELVFAGKVSKEVLLTITKSGLGEQIKNLGYLPHKAVRKLQAESQVLLLLEIDSPETREILPGKLFEYLASHRPILALGPSNWDAKGILDATAAGECFLYSEKTGLKSQIMKWYADYKEGKLHVSSKGLEAYSRENLTHKLVKQLKWE
jgi:hypothetical protein